MGICVWTLVVRGESFYAMFERNLKRLICLSLFQISDEVCRLVILYESMVIHEENKNWNDKTHESWYRRSMQAINTTTLSMAP